MGFRCGTFLAVRGVVRDASEVRCERDERERCVVTGNMAIEWEDGWMVHALAACTG
jgi:hypothetical protein